LNRYGDVIGIAVAVIGEGQNLNFAVPASCLAALINQSAIDEKVPLHFLRFSEMPTISSVTPPDNTTRRPGRVLHGLEA
jgi:S1-C subfamily serine protease